MIPFMKPLSLLLLLISNAALAQVPALQYKTGAKHRYQLFTSFSYNGQAQPSSLAVCEVTTGKDEKGVPFEEVKWISLKSIKGTDTTDETATALAVKPYTLSLDSRGSLALPKIDVAGMTGPITDFHTFYVAVGPQLGLQQLKKAGDKVLKPDLVKGDFSNGKTILVGHDCLQVVSSLSEINKQQAVIKTQFLPPASPCLDLLLPEMKGPVIKDTLNNFQMVRPGAAGSYNVQYGREFFTINTFIRTTDGRIEKADMHNLLNLKVKLNCDSTYKQCQHEVPFKIERELTLKLL
jgi:hypothetical protein